MSAFGLRRRQSPLWESRGAASAEGGGALPRELRLAHVKAATAVAALQNGVADV